MRLDEEAAEEHHTDTDPTFAGRLCRRQELPAISPAVRALRDVRGQFAPADAAPGASGLIKHGIAEEKRAESTRSDAKLWLAPLGT